MIGRLILLDHLGGQPAAAKLLDGRLEDLLFEGIGPAPGTVYRAIADRPVKGQGGMFLRTPDGSAFLRQVKGLAPGQAINVQVTGYAEPGKAIPVTAKLLFKSRYVIVTPKAPGLNVSRSIRDEDRREALQALIHDALGPLEMGMILRSACAEGDDTDILDDAETMLARAQEVSAQTSNSPLCLAAADGVHLQAWRDWSEPAEIITHDGCFAEYGVLDQLADLTKADTPIAQGRYYIEQTRAFTAVDVDTGSDGSPATGLKTNLAMARDLPRQLRLRGLGGQIVIDPAPMAKKDRRQVETALKAALRAEPIETNFVGWTTLGLIELQRARVRAPLKAAQLDAWLS
ncbi:MAG: ribonuclease E/G [Paracoccaceae bacterium]